jgi:hypothetical protein
MAYAIELNVVAKTLHVGDIERTGLAVSNL